MQAGCKRIEDMEWFQVLMFYGYRNGNDLDTADEDLELIPRLVDLVVIPKLAGERLDYGSCYALPPFVLLS